MSTAVKKKRKKQPQLSVETVSRRPQQNRSQASLERMLAAARELMLERGEDFTLQEVSRTGDVSIGSIYLRFESKDNLVRAVIANTLEEIARDEEAMLDAVRAGATSLATLMPAYVDAYAEVLRGNAPLLRLARERAATDSLVAEPGKRSAMRSAAAGAAAMLDYRGEFGGDDHETKATSAYHVIFATLARQLSLGSPSESTQSYDWELLKRELGRMCLAYLKSDN